MKDPFLQLGFELTDFETLSYSKWNTIPLNRSAETVTVLGQGQAGVGDDDAAGPVVSVHNLVEIFRFLTLPNPVSAEC